MLNIWKLKKGMQKDRNIYTMEPKNLLTLDSKRNVIGGSKEALRQAIAEGGDLRIYTLFRHNEHIDTQSDNHELIDEVSDFRVTWLVDNRWVAGGMNLRMPVVPPGIFGERPSWSFFLYNEDGSQAIARPFLDGKTIIPPTGEFPASSPQNMPKYTTFSEFDRYTNAPSQNFIYHFDEYRFFVSDDWTEIYAHDENGKITAGDFGEFIQAFRNGREFKAAIRDFDKAPEDLTYELFTHLGSGYYNTESGSFCINSQPVIVIRSAIPMRYQSENWFFGNMIIKNNGEIIFWRCNPYTMQYDKITRRCAIRYFVKRKCPA